MSWNYTVFPLHVLVLGTKGQRIAVSRLQTVFVTLRPFHTALSSSEVYLLTAPSKKKIVRKLKGGPMKSFKLAFPPEPYWKLSGVRNVVWFL